jgi:hypothetical protein
MEMAPLSFRPLTPAREESSLRYLELMKDIEISLRIATFHNSLHLPLESRGKERRNLFSFQLNKKRPPLSIPPPEKEPRISGIAAKMEAITCITRKRGEKGVSF